MTLRALVTGGISGLGLATAERLRADGTEVVTLDRAPGADVVVDVADDTAVAVAVAELGAIDILINSAGVVGRISPCGRSRPRTGTARSRSTSAGLSTCAEPLSRHAGPRLGPDRQHFQHRGQGREPEPLAYSASKAAVIALTKSLGKELATSGVLVNAIAPASSKPR